MRVRVAVLLDRWRRGHGGLERYLERVLPELAQRHEVWLLARDAARDPPAGVRPLALPGPAWRPRPWRDRHDAGRLAGAARDLGPDVLLAVRAVPAPGCVYQPHGGSAAHLAAARGARGWKARALAALEERTLQGCARLLAVSPKVAQECSARRPGLAVTLLPPPVSAAGAVPPPAAAPPPLCLWCGRDARLKGAAEALAWFRVLRRRWPEARLRMWSASRAHLQRVLGAAPAALAREGVELHGWDGGFAPALAGAALVLHPTRYDACSLVCLEAAAAGVPVLTTAANGLAGLLGEPLLALAPPGGPEAAGEAAAGRLRWRLQAPPAELAAAAGAVRQRFSLAQHVLGLERALTLA